MLKFTLLILCFAPIFGFADEGPAKVTPARLPPPSAIEETPAEAPSTWGENEMGIHMLFDGIFYGPGIGFSYYRLLSPQWTFGGMIFWQTSQLAQNAGGDLDNAQYYDQYISMLTAGLEADAAYYFRHDGARRSSALVRFGGGYAIRQGTAHWTRLDRDPGVFSFNNNRSLESGQGSDVSMSSPYVRVGFHYQFALGKTSITNGHGNILEVGVTSLTPLIRRSASFVKPTGERVSMDEPAVDPALDISYRFIF